MGTNLRKAAIATALTSGLAVAFGLTQPFATSPSTPDSLEPSVIDPPSVIDTLEPSVIDAGDERVRIVPVAAGLVRPWDIALLPGEDAMLVTEAPGRLRVVRAGELLPEPAWIAPSPSENDVLHGVVAHPRFDENRLVYVSYVIGGWRGRTLAVARGRLEHDRLVAAERIFVADAWDKAVHNTAGRMIFGADGMLYLTVGDRDRLWDTDDDTYRLRAQDPRDHAGSLLRLTDDGRVPDDNPLLGKRGAKPEIFAYGFRNGYGLTFHPHTGQLWLAEIGPRGGDEINVIRPGANYGWPLVSSGTTYPGKPISSLPSADPSSAAERRLSEAPLIEPPLIDWTPAITPSSIVFYTGDVFPSWRGNLLVSALSGRQIRRIVLDERGNVERQEAMLTELDLRFRRIVQGPDGHLYAATEQQPGAERADGAILRIEPEKLPAGLRQD